MFKRIAVALIIFCAPFALIALYFVADHYGSRYTSWRALSSEHVFDAAQRYVEREYINTKSYDASEIIPVCVYAVACDDVWARLAIVDDPDQFDFGALKRRIWARRFKGTCQGQTANLGLHVLHSQGSDRPGRDLAIWNFYGDSFSRTGDRHWFIGGAFSDEPWERCSIDRAAYLIENGALVRNPN